MTDENTQSTLTVDVFTILHILEHQTANWDLSARNGRYRLVIRWKDNRRDDNHVPAPVQQAKPRKSTKARRDRNYRRLQAFIARKKESETTIPEPSNPDMDTAEDTDSNSESSDDDSVLDIQEPTKPMEPEVPVPPPGNLDNPETPVITKAEDRVKKVPKRTTTDESAKIAVCGTTTPAKIGREKTSVFVVPKVTLDAPQKTYLFELPERESLLLVKEEKWTACKELKKEDQPVLYNKAKLSHDHWYDVRHPDNFVYSKGRAEAVEKIAEKYNLRLNKL